VRSLQTQLGQAEAALATLDEAVEREPRSPVERDGAILRLIYTFAVVCRACQHLLAEREGIQAQSSNATIRAARRLDWLSDADAEAAIQACRDRDRTFEMYRPGVGDDIATRLVDHAAVLRRWLEALNKRVAVE
jgi:Nucleotidyltransferase substrate binding protein like